ncbi:hypothetical protein KO489_15815 [Reinekea forsetii]|nr:hypothetical protein [Reinekea forsetii]
MTKHIPTLGLAAMLVACSPEEAKDNDQATKETNNNVCTFDPDDSDRIESYVAINNSEHWLHLESMITAAGDFQDTLSEDDFEGAFISAAFLSPSFTDSFSSLFFFYVCTEETYALNQCNYSNENYQTGGSFEVKTTLLVDDAYKTTVTELDSAGLNPQNYLIIDGYINDVGNLTYRLYEEDQLIATRHATRSNTGVETVEYDTINGSWIATESPNCSGSLDFQLTDDEGFVTTIDASWSFSSGSTTGTLNYYNSASDDGHIIRSW